MTKFSIKTEDKKNGEIEIEGSLFELAAMLVSAMGENEQIRKAIILANFVFENF